MHHCLIAHGRSVQVLRERCKLPPIIGWAPVGVVAYPASDDAADVDAARRRANAADQKTVWSNTLFSDPVCLGTYPESALRAWGRDFPKFTRSEMEQIHQRIDFYGLNIYRGTPVKSDGNGGAIDVAMAPGSPINAYHWAVEPPSLYWGPRFIYERYKLPIYITENGMSCLDWVALDGGVHDPQRIDFTRRYLRELRRAMGDGVDVRGYFHWSLMDNFEWADGYRQRFGLVHVDYQTQKRTIKDSGYWYARNIASNGGDLDEALNDLPGVTVTRHVARKKAGTAATGTP
jgi:beta-glucosidase